LNVDFRSPAPDLHQLISAYYRVDCPPEAGEIRDQLHPEWANIRFILAGSWSVSRPNEASPPSYPDSLFGPTSRTWTLHGSVGAVIGVGLLPLGWAQLIRLPASDFADRIVPLNDGLQNASALSAAVRDAATFDAQAAVFDAFFKELLAQAPAPDLTVQRAHAILLDPAVRSAEAFAEALGVSSRHAARLALGMFGFPPKLLLRRQRFLRTLAAINGNPGVPWAQQLDGHYFDESHFIRDFRRFMSETPSRHFGERRPILSPATTARKAVLGAPMQGLHPAEEE
jgi:AraC-like DNA-binding protein